MALTTGVLDDRYELGEPLGSGGMAEVREAHDRRLERPVAVKLLRADLSAQGDLRRRFAGEAAAAARLDHPNAVTVYDTGIADGQPYIVMELVRGATLAQRLAAGRLAVDEVQRIGVDVLGALEAAHRLGIVHRDIKPGNVLITDDGTVKLCDFGIAKSTEGLDITLTGQLVGTPAYMAPERLTGAVATPASDLYSVGVVLFEALSGSRPFTGDSPVAVATAVVRGDAPSLPDLRPEVPRQLVAVVERAMAREPRDRFASAGAMATALSGSAIAEGASPDHTLVMPIDDLPTDRVDVDSVAVGAAGSVPVATAAAAAPTAPPREWPRPSRRAVLWAVGALLVGLFVLAAGLGAAPGAGDDDDGDADVTTTTTTVPTTTTVVTTTTVPPQGPDRPAAGNGGDNDGDNGNGGEKGKGREKDDGKD